MKKNFLFGALTLLFMSLSFAACNSDDEEDLIIYDINPLVIRFEVTDSEGNDLLDPDTENNWRGKPITATHKGETYEMNWELNSDNGTFTRAYLARFYGLYAKKKYGSQ